MLDYATLNTFATGASAELDRLGDSPDQVAAMLRATGARGDRHDPLACPIATYLRRTCGAVRASVGCGDAIVYWGRDDRVCVSLPLPVKGFVAAFDRGEYPELREP